MCVCVWKVALSCPNGVDEQQKMWIGFCVSTIAHLQKVQVCSVSHCVYKTHKFLLLCWIRFLSNSLYGIKISDSYAHPIGYLSSICTGLVGSQM